MDACLGQILFQLFEEKHDRPLAINKMEISLSITMYLVNLEDSLWFLEDLLHILPSVACIDRHSNIKKYHEMFSTKVWQLVSSKMSLSGVEACQFVIILSIKIHKQPQYDLRVANCISWPWYINLKAIIQHDAVGLATIGKYKRFSNGKKRNLSSITFGGDVILHVWFRWRGTKLRGVDEWINQLCFL